MTDFYWIILAFLSFMNFFKTYTIKKLRVRLVQPELDFLNYSKLSYSLAKDCCGVVGVMRASGAG